MATVPSQQTQQLPDGSQLIVTTNPDGSVYYDNVVNGNITATSAFDASGSNLFSTEVQNGSSTQILLDGVSTGAQPTDSAFSGAVSSAQANVTSNPASGLSNVSSDPALNAIDTEVPDVSGGLPPVSGTDSDIFAALTNPDPSTANVVLASPEAGLTRVTTTAVAQSNGSLGPGHINTGSKFGLRHFTFVLRDGINNDIYTVDLNVNPEDMSIENPFRVNTYNTLGGAFVDVWGQGVRRIVMRGHTGWRTVVASNGQQQDGFDNIFALRDNICNLYFSLRDTASKTQSQTDIQSKLTLTLIDKLHETGYKVVPENFKLLRNKARPLLHMYEVSFVVVDDDVSDSNTLTELSKADQTSKLWSGFDSLNGQFGGLLSQLAGVGGPFGKALTDLTKLGGGISNTFKNLLAAKNDFSQGVAAISSVALTATQAVNKALGTIQSFSDFSGIAADLKLVYADVKSTFNELACLIEQIKQSGLSSYTGIVGSCGCCVALFGTPQSPLQNVPNTFETLKQAGDESQLQQASSSFSLKSQTIASKINNIDTPMMLASGA